MSTSRINGCRIAGVSTCVPPSCVDNLECGADFPGVEVRKVVAMAGIRHRHVVDAKTTSADLCFESASVLLDQLGWARESVSALILVTQSPDYLLPSSSCLVHKWLRLSDGCAAFDVGLGCSGYPYGLYLAATLINGGGHARVLVLHGETPSRFPATDDHATRLLFGDCGSATAIEASSEAPASHFVLHTDGTGYDGLIIPGGGFRNRTPSDPRELALHMDGAAIFNFTVKRVPGLIATTLAFAQLQVSDVDWYLFHQSNRFIMQFLAKKCGIEQSRLPMVLDRFGNTGGASVPLALTQGLDARPERDATAMFVGYGVGLSWGAAVMRVAAEVPLLHAGYTGEIGRG